MRLSTPLARRAVGYNRLSYWRETFALERCYADTQTGEAPDRKPGAAMCVQEIRVQCVLQFTLVHAAGCALHRHTSRVIHRPEVWIFVLFSLLDEQHGEPCCCRRFVCFSSMGAWFVFHRRGRIGAVVIARAALASTLKSPPPQRVCVLSHARYYKSRRRRCERRISCSTVFETLCGPGGPFGRFKPL